MTEIKLYNTKTRKKEVFTPADPQNVRMYVCGPTVYDRAHLGNARPVVVFDVLNRLLRHVAAENGWDKVTYVRNFTDVDDKINAAARARKEAGAKASMEALITERSDETISWFLEDMQALGALEPDHAPRATQYIPQMIVMIEKLIAKGHAYEAEGHVLFAVESYKDYGRLSGRSIDDMIAGARVEVAPYKRNPMDFVLWKPSDAETPGWESPWGRGRPGWHIECSAMSLELLGATFDIHGGGNDLQFPHHENEIAQSCCAHPGSEFARFWMHNEMLQVEGKKMSKSLGNFITVRDLLDDYAAAPHHIPNIGPAIRLRFLQTKYRDLIDMTTASIEQAAVVLGRAYQFLANKDELPESEVRELLIESKFIGALANDLNTPLAVKLLQDQIKLAQYPTVAVRNPMDGEDYQNANLDSDFQVQKMLKAMLQFLGFHLKDLRQFSSQSRQNDRRESVSNQVKSVIEELLQARQDARSQKDFARADALRDGFAAAGVIVKDTADGATWEPGPGFDPAKLEALK